MSRDALTALYREANADPETSRLLETYLDRRFGASWRQTEQPQSEPRPRNGSAMSRAEAYRVLGLEPGASEDDIRAAHRKLMLQNHPDKGGTSYLAAKINEAKDVLLG
jgi:DnaJ-class molecular chaperone